MTETATVVDWPKSSDHGTTLWTTVGTEVQHPYTLTNGVLRNRMGQELREAHDKNQWVECTLTVPEVEIDYLSWLCGQQEASMKSLRAYLKHPELESRRGGEF